MPETVSIAKQDRSRKTLAKLLDATVRSLEKDGLEGCTMPRVAAAAGVSAAAVYRHFADKDTLLRTAFLHALQAATPGPVVQAASLEATADNIIAVLLKDSQAHARMLRALTQFLAAAPNEAFARQVKTIRAAKLHRMTEAVLAHRERVRHPEPQRAAMFAVLTASASIEAETSIAAALPLTPKQFSAELARTFVAYLRRKP